MQVRKARIQDLPKLIALLSDDKLGRMRESPARTISPSYLKAFEKIESDSNQYLMVVTQNEVIIGTCHLTLMPSLTFSGSLRMNIEAVRVDAQYRGQKVGEWMIEKAIEYAKEKEVKIIQLTSNKVRVDALRFYQKLQFEATHEGMKLYL